jgi:hypothetical protein
MKYLKVFLIILPFVSQNMFAQQIPSPEENIANLITYGKQAETSYGDDSFFQVLFFQVPKTCNTPIYIRIFDPETSGKLDAKNDVFNTETIFSFYGGRNCSTDPLLRKAKSVSECKSGILLCEESFGKTLEYDEKWYTFGPFNPKEGEYDKHLKTFVFKLIVDGKSGDDGNIYRFFLSSDPNKNVPIEGGNIYTYKYHFRLVSEKKSVTHLYAYIDDRVKIIKQHNFDFDNDGIIKVVSVARNGHAVATSGDNVWVSSELKIANIERNTSMDFQIIKKGDFNNDMVFYLTNQYGEKLPFYTVPIGGIPKYKMGIDVIYHK